MPDVWQGGVVDIAVDRALTALAGEGEVVAATFGADDRLRTILHDARGLVLVTCANRHCTAP